MKRSNTNIEYTYQYLIHIINDKFYTSNNWMLFKIDNSMKKKKHHHVKYVIYEKVKERMKVSMNICHYYLHDDRTKEKNYIHRNVMDVYSER